jgi:SAM-dependent methyltransferase
MEHVKCNCCGNQNTSVLYGGYKIKDNKINLVKCNHCGLIYINPQPSKDEILSYYTQDYYGISNMRFKGIIEKFVHIKREIRAKRIKKYVKSGKILDIGCGRGIFLNEMRKKGYETYGTEISEIGAKYVKEVLKLNVFIGPIEEIKFPDNSFDIITIYHVLEHLPNPSRTLKEIQRILKPGGLLVVSVPNIQSLQSKIFKTYWFHLDIPRHYFHFNLQSLKKILPSEKLDVLKIKRFSFEHGPFGWIQSVLNTIYGNDNILYNILKEETSGTLGIYAKKRFRMFRWTITLSNLLIGVLFAVPATMLSLILSLTNYNEIIEVYYRKRP